MKEKEEKGEKIKAKEKREKKRRKWKWKWKKKRKKKKKKLSTYSCQKSLLVGSQNFVRPWIILLAWSTEYNVPSISAELQLPEGVLLRWFGNGNLNKAGWWPVGGLSRWLKTSRELMARFSGICLSICATGSSWGKSRKWKAFCKCTDVIGEKGDRSGLRSLRERE